MTLPTVNRSRITCGEVLSVRMISKRGIMWAGLHIKEMKLESLLKTCFLTVV